MAFGNTVISLFQPPAQSPMQPLPPLQPADKAQLYSDLLSAPRPPTPKSWGEGLANALDMGLTGFLDARALRQKELDKKQKADALASALFGSSDPNNPNVMDPRRDQLAKLLETYPEMASSVAPMLTQKLFGPGAPDYQYTTVNGTVVRINKATGQTEPVYTSPTSNSLSAADLVQTPDANGRPIYTPASQAAGLPAYEKPTTTGPYTDIGKVNADLAAQRITGDQAAKEIARLSGGAARPFTDAERQAYHIQEGQGGYMDAQGVPHVLGGTNISIDLGTGGGSVPLTDTGAPDPQAQSQFLSTLSPSTAAMVKGIANYEIDPTKSTSLRGNERSQMVALAKLYDPTYDQSQFPARAAMRKSITSGTYSQAVNSANLVIQHLDALHNAIADLGNTDFPLANAAKNAYKQQTGDPSVTRFNTAADAAASELAKVFKGTGVSDVQSIEAWRKSLDINGSPAQIQQAIDTAIGDLLASRLDTIRQQYQSAMGKPIDFTFLTPHSGQVLKSLGIDITRLDPNSLDTQPDLTGGAGTAAPSVDDLIKKYAP